MQIYFLIEFFFINATIKQHRLSLKAGEKYTLRKNFKAEQEYGQKNWWVVSGNYFIKDSGEFQSSSLTFTKDEMDDVIKISKKVM